MPLILHSKNIRTIYPLEGTLGKKRERLEHNNNHEWVATVVKWKKWECITYTWMSSSPESKLSPHSAGCLYTLSKSEKVNEGRVEHKHCRVKEEEKWHEKSKTICLYFRQSFRAAARFDKYLMSHRWKSLTAHHGSFKADSLKAASLESQCEGDGVNELKPTCDESEFSCLERIFTVKKKVASTGNVNY